MDAARARARRRRIRRLVPLAVPLIPRPTLLRVRALAPVRHIPTPPRPATPVVRLAISPLAARTMALLLATQPRRFGVHTITSMDTTSRLIAPSTLPLPKARARVRAKVARASTDTAEAATADTQLPTIPSSTPMAMARVTRGSTTHIALLLLYTNLMIPGPTPPLTATTACTSLIKVLPSGTTEGRDARTLS